MTQSYCRLFPATPLQFDPDEMVDILKGALGGGDDVASLLIRHEDAGLLEKAARALTPLAQAKGVAVVIAGDARLARQCRADGVEIPGGPDNYRAARAIMGDGFIVGAACGQNRHAAMALGEAGADYVSFAGSGHSDGPEPDSVWWAKLFEVPCVEENVSTLVDGRFFAGQAVDFIRPGGEMWTNPQVARQTVAKFNAMIGETKIAME